MRSRGQRMVLCMCVGARLLGCVDGGWEGMKECLVPAPHPPRPIAHSVHTALVGKQWPLTLVLPSTSWAMASTAAEWRAQKAGLRQLGAQIPLSREEGKQRWTFQHRETWDCFRFSLFMSNITQFPPFRSSLRRHRWL